MQQSQSTKIKSIKVNKNSSLPSAVNPPKLQHQYQQQNSSHKSSYSNHPREGTLPTPTLYRQYSQPTYDQPSSLQVPTSKKYRQQPVKLDYLPQGKQKQVKKIQREEYQDRTSPNQRTLSKNSKSLDRRSLNKDSDLKEVNKNYKVLLEEKQMERVYQVYQDDLDDDLQCFEVLEIESKSSRKETRDKTMEKAIERKNSINQRQTIKLKEKKIDPEEEIRKFQKQIENLNATAQYEGMFYLDSRQNFYKVPSNYIQIQQRKLSWGMRAQLVDWMMQVCYEYSLKRETFHCAVSLVDKFLNNSPNLSVSQFQLTGATAIFISSKLEEFQPRSAEDIVLTTNNQYTTQKLLQSQINMCQVLEYQMNPPTLFRYTNRFLIEWDQYASHNPIAKSHPLLFSCEICLFKSCEESSYTSFRQIFQLIDCMALEVKTWSYENKSLVLAMMYLILGKNMKIFTKQDIIMEMPYTSAYLLDDSSLFNDLFGGFIESTVGFPLIDLLPIIQYCATYFILPISYDKPLIPNAEIAEQTMQLQEYCSFQTYNPYNLKAIKKRNRGI